MNNLGLIDKDLLVKPLTKPSGSDKDQPEFEIRLLMSASEGDLLTLLILMSLRLLNLKGILHVQHKEK
jgi:hypothetical protein